MTKELREEVLSKLEKIYNIKIVEEEAHEAIVKMTHEVNEKFQTWVTHETAADDIQLQINNFDVLTMHETNFNFNGEIDYYNGHQCRIISFGPKFAIENLYYTNERFNAGVHSSYEKFDTLEQAENRFLELILRRKIKINDEGFYEYGW